jgi:hypothetical protein
MSRPIGRTIATYGLAAIGGLIGAILLWLATGVVADFLLGLSGMSAREGGRAMVAFFAIGPFGGLLGLGIGVWLVLHRRGAHRAASQPSPAQSSRPSLWSPRSTAPLLVTMR